jgi:hypothetical protein
MTQKASHPPFLGSQMIRRRTLCADFRSQSRFRRGKGFAVRRRNHRANNSRSLRKAAQYVRWRSGERRSQPQRNKPSM